MEICPAGTICGQTISVQTPLLLALKKGTGADTIFRFFVNPILHTAWLNNYALTLKRNTAKYNFDEKSSFLHTFLKICCEPRKI
jgi:hypothetical protein